MTLKKKSVGTHRIFPTGWRVSQQCWMLLALLLVGGNIAQHHYYKYQEEKRAVQITNVREAMHTACLLTNDQPVAIIVSASTPAQLQANLDRMQTELRKQMAATYAPR